MVVPGSAPVIQQDHAIEPDLGRGSTENSAMGSETELGTDQVHPELEEVRKLQELVRRLEIQNQQLRTRSHRNVLGTNTQTNTGVNNHNSGLNGMEINNSINTITEKQELQIMADVHDKLSKIRREVKESDCLKKVVDIQMHYSLPSITEKVSPNSKYMNDAEMQNDVNVSCSSSLDRSSSTELVEDLITIGIHPSVKMSEQNLNEESGDLESFLNDTALDEVEVLELGNCSDEEDSWLYVSPRKSTADQKTESPLKWCRQVLDNPSAETEVACRTLINRLDQAGRWKNLYCSPLASPSAHNLNTETSSCSNALNSPGHLKSTNKPLLTCGSSGYLSMHSALSSQSSVDSELSTSDDSISMGYKLQDLTDVQVMARLQEESLRQDYASSSASVSRRSSSASLHSLRRGTYSDQEFDTYSLEDEDDYDCSLSYRSAHRYSPSPLSSPRCQSPSSGADYSRTTTSRIRPPRRAVQSPMQDPLKYTNNEEEMRHSMPNLARTSLRSLESVRSSRSLESDLQVPSSRLSRIQQPSTIFTDKISSQTAALGSTVWGGGEQPSVAKEWVKDFLEKLDMHKSMDLELMYPRVLRKLADVIAEPLAIIFENSRQLGEVTDNWKRANIMPIFKKGKKENPKNYILVNLTSVPGKIMEQVLRESILKHLEERKVIRNSQHGFTKGKSCLTNLIAFCDEMTGSVDMGKAADVIYLDFSKSSDMVSHSILASKLKNYGLDEWTIRCIESWLDRWAQWVVINGLMSSWHWDWSWAAFVQHLH